jgi:hypothetical protein
MPWNMTSPLQLATGGSKAALFMLGALLLLQTTSLGSGANLPDCLNVAPTGESFKLSEHPECRNDQIRLSGNVKVQRAEEMLKLSPDEIVFIGCAAAPFNTRMVSMHPPFRIVIVYPVEHDSALLDYVPPILHELGHAYQLKRAGSMQKLLESLDPAIERIELGADFLAGLSAHRLGINPGLFERNHFLVGSYKPNQTDSHGRPEDRSSAFRYGYYYSSTDSLVDLPYRDFQDNLFSQTKHN